MWPSRRAITRLAFGLLILGFLGYLGYQFANQREIRLLALDAKNGRLLWTTLLGDNAKTEARSPLAANGRVLVKVAEQVKKYPEDPGTYVWKLVAFDSISGKQMWEFKPAPLSYDGVSYDASGNSVFATVNLDETIKLFAFDLATGKQLWETKFKVERMDRKNFVLATGDRAILLTQKRDTQTALKVLDAHTAKLIWQIEMNPKPDYSTILIPKNRLAVSDHKLFLKDKEGITHAYDLATGQMQFTINSNALEVKSTNSTFYEFGRFGITAFDANSGKERWKRIYERDSSLQCAGKLGIYERFHVNNLVYLTCNKLGKGNEFKSDGNRLEGEGYWLLALDAKDGRDRWFKQLGVRYATFAVTTPISNAESVFTTGEIREGSRDVIQILALSAKDGSEQWKLSIASRNPWLPATDSRHVFVIDDAPRWRFWLAQFNPSWY